MALSQLQSDVMAVLSPSVIDDVYYPGLEGRALMSVEFLEGAINPLGGMSSQPGYEEGNLQECDVCRSPRGLRDCTPAVLRRSLVVCLPCFTECAEEAEWAATPPIDWVSPAEKSVTYGDEDETQAC